MMLEKIETTLNTRKRDEARLLIEIAQLERTLESKRAELISTRGGILELRLLLKIDEIVEVEEEE